MSQPYRPSNGTEGTAFIDRWCCQCARDAALNGSKPFDECSDEELCDIVARTFAHDETDAEYPVEWIRDEHGGPRCTAFVDKDSSAPAPRCTLTLDLPL